MFRETTLALSILLAMSASTFILTAGAASAVENDMPVPAAAAMAQPNGQALLQGVLDQLIEGKTEFAEMEPTLKVNLMQRPGLIASLSTRLQSLGGLQSVSFAGKQNNAEIYDVRFANGNSTWGVVMAPDGRILHMSWGFR